MANLPEQLAVLFTGQAVFDVVGRQPPYVVSQEWLDATRARIAELTDRPELSTVTAKNTTFKQGTPVLVDTFYWAFRTLWPPVGILTGAARNLHLLLVEDHLLEPITSDNGLTNWRETGTSFALPFALVKGEGQEQVIRFVREALDLLADIPGLTARRTALSTILDRILADPGLLEAHRTQSRASLTQLWADEFTDTEVRAAFPDMSRNPLDLLVWGMDRLRTSYDAISAVTPESERPFPEEVASIVRQVGRTDLPAGLSFTVLGPAGTAEVQEALTKARLKVEPDEWRRRCQAWLPRAVEVGAAFEAR